MLGYQFPTNIRPWLDFQLQLSLSRMYVLSFEMKAFNAICLIVLWLLTSALEVSGSNPIWGSQKVLVAPPETLILAQPKI